MGMEEKGREGCEERGKVRRGREQKEKKSMENGGRARRGYLSRGPRVPSNATVTN